VLHRIEKTATSQTAPFVAAIRALAMSGAKPPTVAPLIPLLIPMPL
jgi:hypothetical protein